MKIGILGDIHANVAAFEAVLKVLGEEGANALISAGDIVGYGPQPAECIKIVRARAIPSVLGNHDHYVTLIMDPRLERLRPEVRASTEWTQNALGMEDLKWLAQLPRQLEIEDFTLVHGACGPNPWLYLTNERTFAQNFGHQETALAFCGHSHIPMFAHAVAGLPVHATYIRSIEVPKEGKVMINVGSVGQPRDHDPRAACALYDTETREVRLLRVPYDIAGTQDLMRQKNFPAKTIDRLAAGK